MRFHEIVEESAELDEGWKSKLGAAALAGAAALGGGSADAGGGIPLTVVGKTYDSQGNTIVKYQDGSTRNLGTNEWTAPTLAQQRQNQALAKQKADREAAARAARQSNYTKNYQQTSQPQSVQQDQLQRSEYLSRRAVGSNVAGNLGQLNIYNKFGFLSPEEVKLYDKMIQIFNLNVANNKDWQRMDPSIKKQLIDNAWSNGQQQARKDINHYNNINLNSMAKAAIVRSAVNSIRYAEKDIGKGYDDYINTYSVSKSSSSIDPQAQRTDVSIDSSSDTSPPSGGGVKAYKNAGDPIRDMMDDDIFPVTREKVEKNGQKGLKKLQEKYQWWVDNPAYFKDLKDKNDIKDFNSVLDSVKSGIDLYKTFLANPNIRPEDQRFYKNIESDIKRDYDSAIKNDRNDETSNQKLKKQIDDVIGQYVKTIGDAVKRGFSEPDAKALNSELDTLRKFSNMLDDRANKPSTYVIGEVPDFKQNQSSAKNDDDNIRGGAQGAAQYEQDSKLATKLSDYIKSFKDGYPDIQTAAKKLDKSGLEKLQNAFDYFQKNQNTIKTMEVESDYADDLKNLDSIIKDYKSYLNKSDYKQDQAPSASQSPKSPEVKQTSSKVGFEAKTTGKGTGLTKNGDKYTGEWRDGFADGRGERTLVNKGYTGGMVKTGNKIDTEWKGGVPVDGAKVKVTTQDGKVFNGHIKRTDENPWNYMIVK